MPRCWGRWDDCPGDLHLSCAGLRPIQTAGRVLEACFRPKAPSERPGPEPRIDAEHGSVGNGGPRVPKVSEFFGIAVYVHWRDHDPPHFHAVYAGEEVSISIETLAILKGGLPPRVLGLVTEWALLHQDALRFAWRRSRNLEPLSRIEPL